MSNPNDHHYVPRCFFVPWTNEHKKLVVYQKKSGSIIPPFWQSTKVICVHKNLYSYTSSVEEAKRNVLEQKIFSKIDSNAALVLRKLLIADGEVNLTVQERYYFSVFIASLRIRTPEAFLYNTKTAQETFLAELSKHNPEDDEDVKKGLRGKTLLEWSQNNIQVLLENFGHDTLIKTLIDTRFVQPIMQMHWKVLIRKIESLTLLSSDRPLVLLGDQKKSNLGFALAISPHRIFLATSNYESLQKIFELSPRQLVKMMNISTVSQAKNKAFSVNKNHSIHFFENRLSNNHSILPWANNVDLVSTDYARNA